MESIIPGTTTRPKMELRGLLLLVVVAAAAALQPPSSQEVGYAFEYGVRDESSGTLYAHTEFRHGIVTTGQYTVHLPDGRIQTVKYTADHNGYRATVSYEGLAHHPDKIIDTPSSPTNYPPVLEGRPVPVVGSTVLNRPLTIPQATSVSHTRHGYSGHNHGATSHESGLSAPVSPPVPTSVQRIPVGGDLPPNFKGYQDSTSAISGNFQRGNQYSGAPISPHLLISSSIPASQERDPNSYLPSPQNVNSGGSFERPYAPSVPGVPFIIKSIPLVPSSPEDAPFVPFEPENGSPPSHAPHIPANSYPGKIPNAAQTSSRVPFTINPTQQRTHSFPQHSQRISTHSSLPSPLSHDEQSLTEPSRNLKQQAPTRNTFRVPHKLQSGEQDFKRLPESFNFNRPNAFSSANTENFNEFFSLPSSPQTRPRKFPPNTFIPSAIDPLGPPEDALASGHSGISHQENKFSLIENGLKPQISSHSHGFGIPGSSTIPVSNFNKQAPNTLFSGHTTYQHGTPNHFRQSSGISNQKPFNTPSASGADFENSNQIGFSYNQNDQSIPVPNANSVFIAHDFNKLGQSQNYSGGQSSESSRPKPRPIIVPNQGPFLPSPETKFSSGMRSPFTTGIRSQNVIFRPINEIDPNLFKEPFIIDPDASVFHNEPSIIVDYGRRGLSYGHNSNRVSLTAPYVFVGGAYSPNPASKFAINIRHSGQPAIFAARGIAPPDPAKTGNIVLSPGFLPPHLAKLQKHNEEIRTVPTPEPVQLKLALRRNLDINGVERTNLPLRNQPETFGEGTIHTFTPNSVSKTLKNGKQRRNIPQSGEIGSNDQKSGTHDTVLKNSATEAEGFPSELEFSSKESGKIETRPNIRNG